MLVGLTPQQVPSSKASHAGALPVFEPRTPDTVQQLLKQASSGQGQSRQASRPAPPQPSFPSRPTRPMTGSHSPLPLVQGNLLPATTSCSVALAQLQGAPLLHLRGTMRRLTQFSSSSALPNTVCLNRAET
ncbi:hypothetical protein HaLaN_16060 [Haematococcus lacustris]|uniref:Uncharacterized protein n=1 Tax=Haematococcus lacustris TaxID=44745 RepID=A0A699ZJK0_HAELA|nr:hypothetical protein HaLaN_16060 [Haematococcus lacustris]